MNKEDEILKLSNQICFPLYAAGKEIVRKYTPLLEKYDLTYTQYIVLLVLWENDGLSIKEIGERLYLDSGTLTPLVKKLIQKGLIKKEINKIDEREMVISLTQRGSDLKKDIVEVPLSIAPQVKLEQEEAITLYQLLYKLLRGFYDGK